MTQNEGRTIGNDVNVVASGLAAILAATFVIENIDEQEIPKSDNFRYLSSGIHHDRKIEKNVQHRIKIGWSK